MHYYEMTAAEAAKQMKTNTKNGLDEAEAEKRLLKYGKNEITKTKKNGFFRRFFLQFNDFMIVILLCAAGISYATSLIAKKPDISEPFIILSIVVLNAFLGTIQELKAEHSLQTLKVLATPQALVIRGGRQRCISSCDIVPGDIISLRIGDMVCADCRLIESDGLAADESSLTGESCPLVKDASVTLDPLTSSAELTNMLFSSTHITSGSGIAIVVKTGMHTEVGKIAEMLITPTEPQTPLQKRLSYVSKSLATAALLICGVIFIIGTLKHIPPFEMFMTSVSLAVAAIPEGLPAIVTIMLALGVMKMSKHNAIVRHLPSVETLGCVNIICTDKTGTLTQNKMTVTNISGGNIKELLKSASLCCEEGEYINPTDLAIITAAKKNGVDTEKNHILYKRTLTVPFTSERKRMSVICGDMLIIKGALEYILPLCSHYKSRKGNITLSESYKNKIKTDNKNMADKALRVIACAYRKTTYSGDKTEHKMIFLGQIGLFDPPRPEAKIAVTSCIQAGIRPLMITGDHPLTAIAVAKSVGIESNEALTGTELDDLNDEELFKKLKTCSVFARTTPKHKSRIITSLQAHGEVVAMTGDGINDAPALRTADIGCSMGISGTDVAKSASDIILTDDNFATIVYAVGEGRVIYDNIKKSVKFLLSSNIGEILTVLFGIIFGFAAPFTAIELLWVNLVTDSLPAIALGLDPPSNDIMQRKPLNSKNNLLGKRLWLSITTEGLMIGSLAIAAYSVGLILGGGSVAARTMSFFVLASSQLVHAFNMSDEKSVFKKGILKNKWLVFSFIIGFGAQFAVITLPFCQNVFGVCRLNLICIATASALSFMPLIIIEAQKFLNEHITR